MQPGVTPRVGAGRAAGSVGAPAPAADKPFGVGFNYEPDTARVSVSPSGFSLKESDRSGLFAGSAGLAGTPRHADTYKVTVTLTQTGRADDHTFTVVAACAEGHTLQSDRSCEAPICPAVSWGSLGLGSRTVATAASWGATDCTSKNRPPGHYARYYTFTLGAAADVAIDVSSQHDTYLYLMSGHDTRHGFLHRNNDIAGHDRNSRILQRLPAGRYTVEATTYSANKTGRFKVQARVVAAPALADFQATHDVTVGQRTSPTPDASGCGASSTPATPTARSATPGTAEETLRSIYDIDDADTGAATVEQLACDLQDPGLPPEVNRLGRTLWTWRTQISNWHTARVANAATEAGPTTSSNASNARALLHAATPRNGVKLVQHSHPGASLRHGVPEPTLVPAPTEVDVVFPDWLPTHTVHQVVRATQSD